MGRDNEPPTILVVDDVDDSRQMIATWLRHEGYKVKEAMDGRQALETVKSEQPDLVLMDLSMPGLDGLSAIYRMREMGEMRQVPIVVCTGHSREIHLRAACAVGCDDYLTKPLNFALLKKTINHLLTNGRNIAESPCPEDAKSMNADELLAYLDELMQNSLPV